MIHERERGDVAYGRLTGPSLAGSGGWAKVTTIVGGTITGVVDDFDGGVQQFGPVVFRDLSGDGLTVGEMVWLLVDSAGEPGAALKF